MSNTIKLKRGSGSDPSASDLVVGEVALRTDSGQLFTKKDDGTLTEIGAAAGVSDGDKGDITVSNSGDTFTIDSGVINNAKIASNAAIAGSKITPTFTGNLTCGHINASVDGNTSISLQDTGHGFPASEVKLSNGGRDLNIVAPKDIRLFPQSGELGLVVEANGQVELYFDNVKRCETTANGIDVDGSITCNDIITAGALLHEGDTDTLVHFSAANTIEFKTGGATRMTANNSGVLLNSTLNVNGNRIIIGDSTSGASHNRIVLGNDNDLTIFHDSNNSFIQNATGNLVIETPVLHVKATGNPTLLLEDTDASNQVGVRYKTTTLDWIAGLHGGEGKWKISKHTSFGTNDYFILDASGNLAITNNISLGGTVDGRDVAADGTKLDGIESNATADQSASEILTLIKTVDGVGSGLDADLFDGAQSDTFLYRGSDITNEDFNTFIDGTEASWNIVLNHSGSNRPTGAYTYGTVLNFSRSGQSKFQVYAPETASSNNQTTNSLWFRTGWNTNYRQWVRILDSNDEGSGNGLDADKLDGIQGSSFLRSDADDSATGALTFTRELTFSSDDDGVFTFGGGRFYKKSGTGLMVRLHSANTQLQVENNSGTVLGTFFHSGNDGAGSGLDADTLDGQQGSYYADAASYVKEIRTDDDITARMDSGFYETSTATTAEGWPENTNSWYHLISSTHSNTGNYYSMQIAGNFFAQKFYIRNTHNSGTKAWSEIWTSSTDGSGSGLDADTVDGIQGASLLRSDADDTATGAIKFTNIGLELSGHWFNKYYDAANAQSYIHLYPASSSDRDTTASTTDIRAWTGTTFKVLQIKGDSNDITWGGSKLWTAANDGSGSGLDADTLDGVQGSSFLRSDANDTATGQLTLSGGISTNGKDVYTNNGALIANDAAGAFADRTAGNIDHIWHDDGDNAWNFCSDTTYKNTGNSKVKAGFFVGNGASVTNVNATTLDSIDSGSFLRSDADDVATKRIRFENNVTDNEDDMATSTGNLGCIEIKNTGVGNDAFMAFHAGNDYAFYLGLNADSNCLAVGGWSMGAVKHKIWHAGNDGSGSGLDSDKLDGQEGSYYRNASNLNAGTIPAARIPATITGTKTFSNGINVGNLDNGGITGSNYNISGVNQISFNDPGEGLVFKSGLTLILIDDANDNICNFHGAAELRVNNSKVWTASNDGSGSGLDSDKLDGQEGSYYRNATNLNAGTVNKSRLPSSMNATTFTGDLRVDNDADLRIGDGAANERILIQKADNNVSDHLIFYNNTTRIGEIGCHDNTWLRINQVTSKNIYTPRYIRADAGFFVDGTSKGINGSGNFIGGTIAGASDYGTLIRSNANDNVTGHTEWQDNYQVRLGNGADMRLYHNGSNSYIDNHVGSIYIRNAGTNDNANIYIQARDGENSIICEDDADVRLFSDNTEVFRTDTTNSCKVKHLYPWTNNNYNLGSTSLRWKNLYVQDMHFHNGEENPNKVDGTWGDWTLQEGENDIFMINNRSGKKFKIAMIPV